MNRWILVGLILFLFVSPVSAWLSGWDYRQDINFSESLEGYQVRVDLNNSNVGGNFNWSDNSSLRFVNSTNGNLSYWVESWNETSNISVIWVEVTANINIYMYYGNSGANSESNGTNTFLDFDDFENYADNAALQTAWNSAGVTLETGVYKIYDTSMKDVSAAYKDFISGNKTLEFWVNGDNGAGSQILLRDTSDNSCLGLNLEWPVDNYWGYYDGGWHDSGVVSHPGEWERLKIKIDDTNNKFWVYTKYSGSWVAIAENIDFVGGNDDARRFRISGTTQYFDGFLVRKFASLEPTHTIGSEETEAGAPSITINLPIATTYYNLSIPVNVSVSDESISFWCAIYEDGNLLSNETSNTTYTTTLTKTGGAHNVSVSCKDSDNLTSSDSVDYSVWMGLNISVFYDNGTAAENWNISIQNITDSYSNSSVNNSLVLEWSDIPTGSINITVDDAAPGLYYFQNLSQRNNNNSAYQVFNLTLIAKGDNPINLTADPSFNVFSGQSVTLACSPTEGSASFYLQNILISSPYTFTTSSGTYVVKCNVAETENYRPTEKSETLTSTPLISCMDNETFAFSVNFTTTENITSVNFTTLVNQHYVRSNLGDVYVPGANETWIHVSGGNYYLVVNNTGLSEIQVYFGNHFINNSYGDHAVSNVKTIGSYVQENNYVYFNLLNEIDGGLAVPPNATIMVYFSCGRGYNYLFLEYNVTEFLLASLDHPDKISVRVQYTADSYYSRSLYPPEQDQHFLNFYNVDAYLYALDRIDFIMLDINYYSTKLQIYKPIGNETIIITENYFDASHMISEYLMEDTDYYLRTVASDGTITEFGKISVVEPTQKTLGKQTVNLNPQAVVIAEYVSGNAYADALYQTLYVDYSDLMEQTDQVNITIYFENGTVFVNESYIANTLSLSYNISNFTNQSYWVDYSVIHGSFGNFTFGMEVSPDGGLDAGLPDWLNLMVAMTILVFIGGLATRSSIFVSTILLLSWLIMFIIIGWFPSSSVFVGLLVILGVLGIIIHNRQGGE